MQVGALQVPVACRGRMQHQAVQIILASGHIGEGLLSAPNVNRPQGDFENAGHDPPVCGGAGGTGTTGGSAGSTGAGAGAGSGSSSGSWPSSSKFSIAISCSWR